MHKLPFVLGNRTNTRYKNYWPEAPDFIAHCLVCFQLTKRYFSTLTTAYHTENVRCCCSCRGRLCSHWHDPCGEQQFHAVQLKARWNLGEQLAWLTDIYTLWCCYWIGADTIKSSPSVLYHLCRVAAFQLHFLAERLLVVCWEATCVCVVGVFPPSVPPGASRSSRGGKSMRSVCPQTSSYFPELIFLLVCVELTCANEGCWTFTYFVFCR